MKLTHQELMVLSELNKLKTWASNRYPKDAPWLSPNNFIDVLEKIKEMIYKDE